MSALTWRRGFEIGDRRIRAASLGLTVVIYAGGALLLLAASPPSISPVVTQTTMTAFDVSSPAPAVPEPARAAVPMQKPAMPLQPDIVPQIEMVSSAPSALVVSMLAEADRAALQGGACDLSGPVQAALQASSDVAQGLPTIAASQRSVANAVMLWDGTWTAAIDRLPPVALQAIRTAVTQTLSLASEQCRAQEQAGPRLLYLPGADATTVLVLGSGQWRWQDVADTAVAPDEPQAVATLANYEIAAGTLNTRH